MNAFVRIMAVAAVMCGVYSTAQAATCASNEYDAVRRCQKHLHHKNCVCVETVSAAQQCFRYGHKLYQCNWN